MEHSDIGDDFGDEPEHFSVKGEKLNNIIILKYHLSLDNF
jgi:hypothetical protein